ncbi:hypothetical protein Moror_10001 [Moniliophthora roreri MCA 2997]|uniref:Uncharacterized protein n=1 Tax=Moniliophthora roreri (strain MCA 2997) TaxID=1381753 RepID=V2WVH7_MONRO|nr:hypothetical protein Moror_10001 [Moniliophthora roreri MCA 2997]
MIKTWLQCWAKASAPRTAGALKFYQILSASSVFDATCFLGSTRSNSSYHEKACYSFTLTGTSTALEASAKSYRHYQTLARSYDHRCLNLEFIFGLGFIRERRPIFQRPRRLSSKSALCPLSPPLVYLPRRPTVNGAQRKTQILS